MTVSLHWLFIKYNYQLTLIVLNQQGSLSVCKNHIPSARITVKKTDISISLQGSLSVSKYHSESADVTFRLWKDFEPESVINIVLTF